MSDEYKEELQREDLDFPKLNEQELDARLRELGYDPVELVKRMRARIERAIKESPLNKDEE